MARITGVGGVFQRPKSDEKALAAWYEKHLGMQLDLWGVAVLHRPDDNAEDKVCIVWHLVRGAPARS